MAGKKKPQWQRDLSDGVAMLVLGGMLAAFYVGTWYFAEQRSADSATLVARLRAAQDAKGNEQLVTGPVAGYQAGFLPRGEGPELYLSGGNFVAAYGERRTERRIGTGRTSTSWDTICARLMSQMIRKPAG